MKSRYWAFIIYPESVSANWLDTLQEYHLPMAVSPLHDKDINDDGSPKKPHRHVVVAYGNTTTEKNIQQISDKIGGTKVIPVMSLRGYYNYLTHKDNPEKAQYDSNEILMLSGFDPSEYWSLTAQEEEQLTLAIEGIIESEKIYEPWALGRYLAGYDLALHRFYRQHITYFAIIVRSFRHLNKKPSIDSSKN